MTDTETQTMVCIFPVLEEAWNALTPAWEELLDETAMDYLERCGRITGSVERTVHKPGEINDVRLRFEYEGVVEPDYVIFRYEAKGIPHEGEI
ncbi:hypothetical protein SEA_JOURNEY13_39 [Mycobacterium phage Journey13]|nr:hypothetical protein SEA_JOURNEY13_39 [Mycobacterium phage Journey13]